jgi:hypothetical protein
MKDIIKPFIIKEFKVNGISLQTASPGEEVIMAERMFNNN